jgi:NAD+ synthase
MKQRTRKQIEYYHADRLNFAVSGAQPAGIRSGFFVKNDGAADSSLLRISIRARSINWPSISAPEEVRRQPPTTDTWSLPQTQDEFTSPFLSRDDCLFG